MAKKDSLHVFIKSMDGQSSFVISSADIKKSNPEEIIHHDIITGLSNSSGSPMEAQHAGYEAMILSLEHITKNLGTNNIPKNPNVYFFSNYKVDYLIEVGENKPGVLEQQVKKFQAAKKLLQDKGGNEVRIFWVPDPLVLHFDLAKQNLLSRKSRRPKS